MLHQEQSLRYAMTTHAEDSGCDEFGNTTIALNISVFLKQ